MCAVCLDIGYYSSRYRYDIPFTRTRLCYSRDYFVRALCGAGFRCFNTIHISNETDVRGKQRIKNGFWYAPGVYAEFMSKPMRTGHRDMASKVILIIVIHVKYSYSSAGRSMFIIIILLLLCYETTHVWILDIFMLWADSNCIRCVSVVKLCE